MHLRPLQVTKSNSLYFQFGAIKRLSDKKFNVLTAVKKVAIIATFISYSLKHAF
ncbi:hypothetical protein [Vibrio gallaecicus]|uniref:hypothetical protein n=1 Tax=Vibrio gallaecicus TaxID=552386 RepID=UPI0025B5F287|nr:hypothetical protein [Vibrio gallaecicus]MDN3616874.1 hypothetical protein [Vibrio gallaecicus]